MSNTRTPVRGQRPAPPRDLPAPRRILKAGAVLVVAVVAVVLLERSDKGSTPTATPAAARTSSSPAPLTAQQQQVKDFKDGTLKDITPLAGDLVITFIKDLDGWQKGTITTSAARAEVDHALPFFVQAREALDARAPLPFAPQAIEDYRLGAQLYIASAYAARAATGVGDHALAEQLGLSYQRLYRLGDRLFDQANVILDGFLPSDQSEAGVEVVPPVDVPDWASIDLAAGPPLDTTPAKDPVQHYQQTRPQQPLAGWVKDVAGADVPSGTAEAAAISTGSTEQLRTMTDALEGAVTQLTAIADPTGERAASTRVRLGLLVDGEATRTAEAATLVSGASASDLRTLAESVARVGDQLWDARLGARTTSFTATLLTAGTSAGG